MDERRIAYLCDGKACSSVDCYAIGGACKHTFDPAHAKNGPFDPDRFHHMIETYYLGDVIVPDERDRDLLCDDSTASVSFEYWIEMEDENEPRD